MTTPTVAKPYTIHDVALASAAVTVADDAILAARDNIAALRERSAPLHAKVAEEAARPGNLAGPDPAMVDALVAAPSSAPDADAIAAAISASRKDEDVRALTIATLNEAIGRFDAQIAQIEAEIAALQERRKEEWIVFVTVASEFLTAAFRAKFLELRNSVLTPLVALQELRNPDDGNKLLATVYASAISPETVVELRRWPEHGSGWLTDRLFPVRDDRRDWGELSIWSFRQALPTADKGDQMRLDAFRASPAFRASLGLPAQPSAPAGNEAMPVTVPGRLREVARTFEAMRRGTISNAVVLEAWDLLREATEALPAGAVPLADRASDALGALRDPEVARPGDVATAFRQIAAELAKGG